MNETYLEQYIDAIKTWTFASSFIPLSKHVAQEIVNEHEKYVAKGTKEARDEWKSNAELNVLAKSIDDVIKSMGVKHIFVRLSSRSPKDAALCHPQFRSLFDKALAELRVELTEASKSGKFVVEETNLRLHALYKASTEILMSSSGEEAIALLVTSNRIQNDLSTYVSSTDNTPFNVAIREFKFFDVMYEFRGFVYENKITALTQYNEFVHFPLLLKQKDKIEQVIKDFFTKEMIPRLNLSNYVIDFILINNGESYDIYVVELNPFAEFAGGGLFSWVNDLNVLIGKAPFEFRVVNQPVDAFTLKTMYNEWGQFLSATSHTSQ